MRTVIKQGDAPTQVRSISRAASRPAVERAGPTALDLADAEILRLKQRIADLEADLADEAAEVPKAFEKGRTEGFEAGKAAGEADQVAVLSRVETGVDKAVRASADALASLERLAPLIAREGLRRVLGDALNQEDLVLESVRQQLAGLSQSAVVLVEVSRRDFAPEDVQRRLADPLTLPATRFDVREELGSGECRIRLMLGALEVGPAQQWRLLEDLLTDLARGGKS
jgi:flagellar biosynthesis/type III secretory pathway protein FliH